MRFFSITIIGVLVLFLTPLMGGLVAVIAVPVVLSAVVAYRGLTSRIVIGSLSLLILMEIVWGIGLGTWSLAYLFVLLLLRLVEGFVVFTPWAYRVGWSWGAFVQTVIQAWLSAILMMAVATLCASIYAGLSIGTSLSVWALFVISHAPGMVSGSMVLIFIMWRINTPLHQRIEFATT